MNLLKRHLFHRLPDVGLAIIRTAHSGKKTADAKRKRPGGRLPPHGRGATPKIRCRRVAAPEVGCDQILKRPTSSWSMLESWESSTDFSLI